MQERGSAHHPSLGPHVRSSIRLATSALVLIGMVGVMAPSAATAIPSRLGIAQDVPLTVKVPIRTVVAPDLEALNGVVDVRLGDSAAFPVMLDTGSVGLRVFPGVWSKTPRSVKLTSTRVVLGTGSRSTTGTLGSAPITIGGVTSTRPVIFQVVPTSSPYIEQWLAMGVYGILGVGTGSSPVPNPLSALPAGAGRHWSIHFTRPVAQRTVALGSLVLGALPPADASATLVLPPEGPNADSVPLWNDHEAKACWTFGHLKEQCVGTWLDSGFHFLRAKGAVFSRVPTQRGDLVRSGTPITMAASGSGFATWRFVAGTTPSRNVAKVLPKGRAGINTGNAPFFEYTVTYDIEQGLISLSTPPQRP